MLIMEDPHLATHTHTHTHKEDDKLYSHRSNMVTSKSNSKEVSRILCLCIVVTINSSGFC